MLKLNCRKFLVLLGVAVFLLGVVILFSWKVFFRVSDFHAVYLRTGDVYFGKLSYAPFGLSQVYTLQVNPQNQQTPINIQRFVNVFWGPEDFMKINKDEVVWVVRLNPQGQLAQLIRTNPNLVPPQGAPASVPQTGAPLFEGPVTQPPSGN